MLQISIPKTSITPITENNERLNGRNRQLVAYMIKKEVATL